MKLVQLNIWGGKLQYQIPDFLNSIQPDIVCMQEVNDLPGPSGALFVTLDELQEKCGFEHRFMSPTYSSKYMNRSTKYGNAILSKLPTKQTNTIFTHGSYKDNFDLMEDDFNTRNLQHIQLSVESQTIHILNHHGYLIIGSKAGNDETVRQMHLVANYLDALHGPILLAGDFNLTPPSESMGIINSKLRNLSLEHNLTSTYTHFNNNQEVCDYIFVNDQVRVASFEMSDEIVSDHKALILEFDV